MTVVDYKKYVEYLKSPQWEDRKRKYFKNKEKKCWGCGSTNRVQLHHKTYTSLYQEKDHHLVPVCGKCHDKIHKMARDIDIGMRENKWSHNKKWHLYYITELVLDAERAKQNIKNTKTRTITYTSPYSGKVKTKEVSIAKSIKNSKKKLKRREKKLQQLSGVTETFKLKKSGVSDIEFYKKYKEKFNK